MCRRVVQFQQTGSRRFIESELRGRKELPGVLAWMLEGLERWIANGRKLTTPDVIRADTNEYMIDADPVKEFTTAHLSLDPIASVTVKELYDAFSNWWTENVDPRRNEQAELW